MRTVSADATAGGPAGEGACRGGAGGGGIEPTGGTRTTPATTAAAARLVRVRQLGAELVDVGDARADGRVVKNLRRGGAAARVLLEELHDEKLQLHRVVRGQRCRRQRHDLAREGQLVARDEGRREAAQFKGEAAERPHVRLRIVRPLLAHLGREVERRAHARACVCRLRIQQPPQAEVADLDGAAPVRINILRLDVAVQHAHRVHVMQALADLHQNGPDHLLVQIRRWQRAVLAARARLDLTRQVAAREQLHDDVQVVAVQKRLLVRDYVGVLQPRHDVDLVEDLRALRLREAGQLDELVCKELPVFNPARTVDAARGALSEQPEAFVARRLAAHWADWPCSRSRRLLRVHPP